MRAFICFFWILFLGFTIFAENFHIAVAPFILKGVNREQSNSITDEFMKKYNQTALYKLMDREKVEGMLSKQLLDRSADFSETSYNLAIARVLSVQYLLFGTIEKAQTGNTFTINIFDFKAQTNIIKFKESGKESPEKLALKMIPLMVAGIDEILSNDRVILSLIEAEKNAAQEVNPAAPVTEKPLDEKVTQKKLLPWRKHKTAEKTSVKTASAEESKTAAVITPSPATPEIAADAEPKIKTEEKQSSRDSIARIREEAKRLKADERYKRRQAAILSQTEEKRLKAQNEFENNNKNETVTESTEAPLQKEPVKPAEPQKTEPDKRETTVDTNDLTEPQTVQNIQTMVTAEPETPSDTKTAEAITPTPAAVIENAPETEPEIKTEETPSKRDSIAQIREEKKRLKAEERFKRKQDAILAETEKKRAQAEKEFELNRKKILGTESAEEPQQPEINTKTEQEKTAPLDKEKPAETNDAAIPSESNAGQKIPAQDLILPEQALTDK